MSLRKTLALAAALILTVPAAAVAQDFTKSGIFENGKSFPYHYLVKFWRNNPPGTTKGKTDDERAPGLITRKPVLNVHNSAVPKAEIALIERKLNIINDALYALPPLRDIKGSSLSSTINITKDGSGRPYATLLIGAAPLVLSSPATTQTNGRYFTKSNDVTFLTITFNGELRRLKSDEVELMGTYNNVQVQKKGRNYDGFLVNSTRPVTVTNSETYDDDTYTSLVKNPDFFDRAARPSQLQLLTMEVGATKLAAGHEKGTADETLGASRLLAALYMADWKAIMAQVAAVK
ncbi:hypothetical protein [Allosphingosinicella vermicomposti]|uniref:hypothetical protein n=1 Tax=Allosphingosinicella vermicomposti TaxID=614671 RepID=UPI000D111FC9|nr:hypothetical protein [Allosphingosinicella vermicomposti]